MNFKYKVDKYIRVTGKIFSGKWISESTYKYDKTVKKFKFKKDANKFCDKKNYEHQKLLNKIDPDCNQFGGAIEFYEVNKI